jgi:hypothetical protein
MYGETLHTPLLRHGFDAHGDNVVVVIAIDKNME